MQTLLGSFVLISAIAGMAGRRGSEGHQGHYYPFGFDLIRCTQPKNRTAKATIYEPADLKKHVIGGAASALFASRRRLGEGLILAGKGPASAQFVWRLTWFPNKEYPAPPTKCTALFTFKRENADLSKTQLEVHSKTYKYAKRRDGTYVAEVASPEVPLEGRIWVTPMFTGGLIGQGEKP